MSDRKEGTFVPAPQSRCVMCGHPDRQQLDDDLICRRRTQSAIAASLGIHPSAVSRHLNNHTIPNLANKIVTDGAAVTQVGDELDRLYNQARLLMGLALGAGDLRMARDFFREQLNVLELELKFAERMPEHGLKRIIDQTAEGRDRSAEQLREDLYARFASLDEKRKIREAAAVAEMERQQEEKRLMREQRGGR
ncbi:MAG TPA: hypothetical protein VLT15_03755 [Acidimicrobiia bacterium]|nr:hypothetical protein [Acidimicrobiia bacterium]